jgi:hypothetical protein
MSRWGRLLLGLFVFGWINAVAQPCLMAMTSAVATEVSTDTAHAAHGHHADAGSERPASGGCGHCPGGAGAACHGLAEASSTQCDQPADVLPEGRQKVPDPRDLPGDLPLACTDPPISQRPLSPPLSLLPDVELPLPAGRPLTIRFCVFLK